MARPLFAQGNTGATASTEPSVAIQRKGHARGIVNRKVDQEQVIDDRKGENRRFQERDQK